MYIYTLPLRNMLRFFNCLNSLHVNLVTEYIHFIALYIIQSISYRIAGCIVQRFVIISLGSFRSLPFVWSQAILWMMHWNRADSRFVPNQWKTALLCNDVSHWLGSNLESPWLKDSDQICAEELENASHGYSMKNFSKIYPCTWPTVSSKSRGYLF